MDGEQTMGGLSKRSSGKRRSIGSALSKHLEQGGMSAAASKRKRSTAASAALFCLGSAVLLFNGTSHNASPLRRHLQADDNGSLLPRELKSSMFKTHLEKVDKVRAKGSGLCEKHFYKNDDGVEGWHDPQDAEGAPPVPSDSKLQSRNNFVPKVDYSKLNIMVVGDSISENMAFFLEDALGLDWTDNTVHAEGVSPGGVNQPRLWYNKLPEERGGGYVAFARVLSLWEQSSMVDSSPNFRNWYKKMFSDFTEDVGDVDVLIYRVPWQWITRGRVPMAGKVSMKDYAEIVRTAHETVHPHTVMFATTPINNNAMVIDDFEGLRKDNSALREFVDTYQPPEDAKSGVQNVLMLDWERLTDNLILENADIMGIPRDMAFKHKVSGDDVSQEKRAHYYFPQLTAMACASTNKISSQSQINTCLDDKRGRLSVDGTHFCGGTVGPRTAGGAICQIQCSIASNNPLRQKHDGKEKMDYLRECERNCNNMHMTLDTTLSTSEHEPYKLVPAVDLAPSGAALAAGETTAASTRK